MTEVTVRDLAQTVGMTPDGLLEKMQLAGLPHGSADEAVSDEQRQKLLAALGGGESSARAGGGSKITLTRRKKTTLKSRGGKGAVDVQVKQKRTYVRREKPAETPAEPETNQRLQEEEARIREEEQRRIEAQRRVEEEKRQEEEARKRKAEEEAQRKLEEEEAARRKAEEDAARAQVEAQVAASQSRRAAAPAVVPVPGGATPEPAGDAGRATRRREARKPERSENRGERHAGHGRGRRLGAKDLDQSGRRARPGRRQKSGGLQGGKDHGFQQPVEKRILDVEVPDTISVSELAQRMAVKASEVIKEFMKMGEMVTINQVLEQDAAALLVEEMGHRVKLVHHDAVEKELERHHEQTDIDGERAPRAPVVTVMGHVDHGKTSLLDYIRSARVAAGEAGGITQHIGAYQVTTESGQLITFLDTPGHAAFTAMRARGAQLTDIVILVVAADDGVMPQTEEAVQHAKAAGVPIVVAVNKIDKEDADPDRVRNELSARDVIPEEWGGDTQFINVSALSGEGVEELLEAVYLQAEILELDAVYDAPARGVVVESQLDRGRGPVATLLVQNGRLHRGDVVVAGEFYGKVRAMIGDNGEPIQEAGPSMPVEILGLSGVPDAGDIFSQTPDDKSARELVEYRRIQSQERRVAQQKKAKIDNLFSDSANKQVMNIVLKADVRGSLEALVAAVAELGTDEVSVNVVSQGVGGLNENDANLALTSGAALIGFNVRADNAAKKVIERENLDLRYYSIIYELLDDIKAILSGMLAPEVREEIVGVAEVRDVFHSAKFGDIAGCMVLEGTIFRNKPIRVLRDNVVIYEGELESLRRFKDDVQEVRNGMECGIGVRNYQNVKPGDQIEVFDTREIERTL